ncbi:MAG: hypothetical protein FIA92_10725 [Chloroflexi bacterium]|nr:hypothetical protein [Chloroflexota bacterium]
MSRSRPAEPEGRVTTSPTVSPLIDALGERLSPALRLQILTTEHWSLLSTRALTWNEAFSRATMFLSAVTGSVVALALVAGVAGFDDGFVVFALLLLPVLLFVGVSTFRRLIEINREDVRWVVGMNRLRHAYLEAAPELRPYFVTGWSDDEGGIMTTFGARPGAGSFAHEFVTTPGLIAVVDGVLAGVLAAILGLRIGAGTAIGLGLAVGACVATIALLAILQYGLVIRPRGLEPSFPEPQRETSVRNR